MDERVDEIRALNRINPLQKVALATPKKGSRELMYQLKQHHKSQNSKRNSLSTKEIPDVSELAGPGTVLSADDIMVDLKKRIAFDRALIIGD